MKAYLIDPAARTITEVEDPKWEYDAITIAIGARPIDVVGVGRDQLIVDDEGFLKPGLAVFELRGHSRSYTGSPYRLCGKALWLGVNDHDGENTSPHHGIDWVRGLIQWTDLESTGDMEQGRELPGGDPDFPGTFVYVGGDPIVRPRRQDG